VPQAGLLRRINL